MEIKQLPHSKTTQDMIELREEIQKSICDSFALKNPNPTNKTIQQFRISLDLAIRVWNKAVFDAIAVECPGTVISMTNEEYEKLYVGEKP